ncbi:MAG: hypothetical protein ACPGGD_03145 [Thalassolituus sp.]|jgi:hypothetical protein
MKGFDCDMPSILNVPTYATLLDCIGDAFEMDADIAKIAVVKINALGPFERGDFEVCDVIAMIGHLFIHDLIQRDLKERVAAYGGSVFYDHYFSRKTEVQPELF